MDEKQLLLVIGGEILDHISPEDLMEKMVQFFEEIEERKQNVITEVSASEGDGGADVDGRDANGDPNNPKEMGPLPLSSVEQAVMETLQELLQT